VLSKHVAIVAFDVIKVVYVRTASYSLHVLQPQGGDISHLKVAWHRLCRSVVGCGLRLTQVYWERYSTCAISTRKWVFGCFYFDLPEWFFLLFPFFFAKELDMARSETLLCPLETV